MQIDQDSPDRAWEIKQCFDERKVHPYILGLNSSEPTPLRSSISTTVRAN